MTCDSNCRKCDAQEGNNMQIQNFNVNPNPAKPGDFVSISFTIVNTSFVGALTTVACLYDTTNPSAPECLISSVHEVGAYGSVDIKWDNIFAMGYKSRPLNVSVSVRFATWTICDDFHNFTVDVLSPPGAPRYGCAGNQCVPMDGGRYLTSNCDNECVTTPPPGKTGCDPACSSTQMCLFGSCQEKNNVFIVVGLLLAYMFLKKG